jgi:hypothetical protein
MRRRRNLPDPDRSGGISILAAIVTGTYFGEPG